MRFCGILQKQEDTNDQEIRNATSGSPGHRSRYLPGDWPGRVKGPPARARPTSVGEAVQAMVLKAPGFTGRPLYLTPEFFANKPLDRLLRPGLTAEILHDDSLGRALDMLHE
ncbi:DUF4277 domain-containing protein [Rhodothermus marinus]|uniref:DUF4277 domain-containing protein n=1 Tax=Rhodothermus marinus TaxID=29549 RepID=UPI0009D6CA28|nr:DUF4277 domain-containing protein [Rhodothermus marinus]